MQIKQQLFQSLNKHHIAYMGFCITLSLWAPKFSSVTKERLSLKIIQRKDVFKS